MTAPLRRAFLAAVPSPSVLDAVGELAGGATRRGFRWARREQWHVTIQYFGRVERTEALIGALAEPLVRIPAFRVQLCGAGGFPSDRHAVVYWLGVADPEPLAAVHAAVMRAAGDFVRPRDRTTYVPHLTVARMKSAKKVTEEVAALASIPFGPAWTVEELTLFESETHPDGAIYREIARLPLG